MPHTKPQMLPHLFVKFLEIQKLNRLLKEHWTYRTSFILKQMKKLSASWLTDHEQLPLSKITFGTVTRQPLNLRSTVQPSTAWACWSLVYSWVPRSTFCCVDLSVLEKLVYVINHLKWQWERFRAILSQHFQMAKSTMSER